LLRLIPKSRFFKRGRITAVLLALLLVVQAVAPAGAGPFPGGAGSAQTGPVFAVQEAPLPGPPGETPTDPPAGNSGGSGNVPVTPVAQTGAPASAPAAAPPAGTAGAQRVLLAVAEQIQNGPPDPAVGSAVYGERPARLPAAGPPAVKPPVRDRSREIIVRYRDGFSTGASGGAAARALQEAGARMVSAPAGPGGSRLVQLAQDAAMADVLAKLRQDPAVVYAEPNYVLSAQADPDDPRGPVSLIKGTPY